MTVPPRLASAALVLLVGCAPKTVDPDAGSPEVDSGTPAPYVDLSGPVFTPDHVVQVAITLPAADWDALRQQTRTIGSVIEGNCLSQPVPSPFSTFTASITIDGTTFSKVGIKKKGFFGSLDPVKPSLKVTFDEFVAGAEYLGLEKLTLNNSHQDPSYVRQCLAYQTFAAAGVVVPRCNFAHVRVNGTDLGIYVNVETIDHKLVKKRYADASGGLYEGTLSDFRKGWLATFDAKGNGADGGELARVANVLDTATDAELETALAPTLDVDRFYTYWAMEVLTNHWDGYANDKNNFFIYGDPTTGQADFIPWGVDATFQPGVTFGGIGTTDGPVAVAAAGHLAFRLFAIPATRAKFLARQRELLNGVWEEPKALAEIARMEALIAPTVDAVAGTSWHTAVAQVRQFVNGRRAALTAALDAGPTWPDPLAGYPCLKTNATVQGGFSTTWGTIGAANPFLTGNGSLSIKTGNVTTVLTPIGATSGLDPNPAPGKPASALVELFGVRASDNHVLAVFLAVPQFGFFPRDGDLGFFDSFGVVYDYDPVANSSVLQGFILGTFTLGAASMTPGAPVVGTFSGNIDVQGTAP